MSGGFLPIPMPHSCMEMSKLLSVTVMGPQASNYLEIKAAPVFLESAPTKTLQRKYVFLLLASSLPCFYHNEEDCVA